MNGSGKLGCPNGRLDNVRSPPHTVDKHKSQNNEILKYENRMWMLLEGSLIRTIMRMSREGNFHKLLVHGEGEDGPGYTSPGEALT